ARGVSLPPALGWAGLVIAFLASSDAMVSRSGERMLRGWWIAALGLGLTALCWRGSTDLLAALVLLLATLSLWADGAAHCLGTWNVNAWRGLRRLAPGAGAAALLALVGTLLLLCRHLHATLDLSAQGIALAAGCLLLLGSALRVAACAIRGAAVRPERGPITHLAFVPALALPFLALANQSFEINVLGAGLATLALILAGGLSRGPVGGAAHHRDRLVRILEPYSPQRRLVQPLLSQARKCAAREERWFEGARLGAVLVRLVQGSLRSPQRFEAWLSTRSFSPPSRSPWRTAALEVFVLLVALAVALFLLRS
ncbi:MAG: hypothetical protein JKY65_13430, partial [Planctomycetes bacterium]|nr:hypothetical protein [Planctomycetota bacterium]